MYHFGGRTAMVRHFNRLSARAVATLTKPGRHADGGGLYLTIDKRGGRRWTFMFERGGRQREAGLVSAASVPLAKARALAAQFREALAAGQDPIATREASRRAREGRKTFGEIADALIAAKEAGWRSEKHKAQWRTTLETYAAPLRSMPVEEVDTEAVLSVLQPIWRSKFETASRLRGRIEAVLDAARAKGLIPRNEANPARWKGHLAMLLPKRQALSRGHHAAMPYAEVPAFVTRLRQHEALSALALEFLILTATRAGEACGARWDEIDFAAKIWTISAARMKAARVHRVPLSAPALAILEGLGETRIGGPFVFPGRRSGAALSTKALAMLLQRLRVDVTVHGFRSSFRDWCGNETSFPREIAEAALAHQVGGAVEIAYRRGDALEKRRALMESWAAFCEPRAPSKVIPLRKIDPK
jgi:integrase